MSFLPYKRAPRYSHYGEVAYINAGARYPVGETGPVDAVTDVERTTPFLERADAYYMGVMRLTLALYLPYFLPQLHFPSDGLTTIYEARLVHRDLGTNALTVGPAVALKLLKAPDEVMIPVTPESAYANFYAAYSTPYDYCTAFNAWMAQTVAAYNTAHGTSPHPTAAPYTVWDTSTRTLSVTAANYQNWAVALVGEVPEFSVWFNPASAALLKGFPTAASGALPSPTGLLDDWTMLRFPTACGCYAPISPDAPLPDPGNPTHAVAVVKQASTSLLPTISTLRVLTDLPAMGEAVESRSANETALILTDFKIDPSQVLGNTTVFYNAAVGTARWIKLVGTAPVTRFYMRVEMQDIYGFTHRAQLRTPGDEFELKIGFATNNVVQNY